MLLSIYIDKKQEDKRMKKAKSILALLMAFVMLMSFAVTGSAATVAEESEDNGTAKTADAFGFGTEIKGVLDKSTDTDWYSFTPDASGLAYVNLKHDEIADANKDLAYFEATIYDATAATNESAAKILATFRSTGAQKTSASPSFAIDKGVTYFIKVTMGTIHSETLSYSLIASIESGALTEKEPNNIAAKATPLELSTRGNAKIYYGSISVPENAQAEDDVDWYRIVPSAKGVVYVYLYNGTIPADFKATLYSHYEKANGVLDEKVVTTVEIDSNKTDAMSVAIGVDAKEYMLKIEGLNECVGGYKTRVFFEAASDAEAEYNNTEEKANEFTVGKAVRGTISHDTDVDCFKFKAVGEDNVGFKISLGSAASDVKVAGSWYISVKDAATKETVSEIYKDVVNAGKAVEFTTEKLVAGRYYYVTVEKGGTLTTDIYKLSVTKIEPKPDDGNNNNGDFFAQIKAYWAEFWKNFEGWFEQINIIGIVKDLLPGIVNAMPELFAFIFNLFG